MLHPAFITPFLFSLLVINLIHPTLHQFLFSYHKPPQPEQNLLYFSKCPPSDRIIIVGAGMAGLTTAHGLISSGISRDCVLIVEQQNRVGGRILTNRNVPRTSPFYGAELGAGWIHGGKGGNPIKALSNAYELKTFWVGGDSSYVGGREVLLFNRSGEPISEWEKLESFGLMERVWDMIEAEISRRRSQGSSPVDTPLCSFLNETLTSWNLSPSKIQLLSWHFEVIFGGDFAEPLCNISLLDLNLKGENYWGGDEIFINGYQELPIKMAKGLHILLEKSVNRILYSSTNVEVHLNGEDVLCGRMVVITVSAG